MLGPFRGIHLRSMLFNSQTFHENAERTGPTRGAKFNQDDHGPVPGCNRTITPLAAE